MLTLGVNGTLTPLLAPHPLLQASRSDKMSRAQLFLVMTVMLWFPGHLMKQLPCPTLMNGVLQQVGPAGIPSRRLQLEVWTQRQGRCPLSSCLLSLWYFLWDSWSLFLIFTGIDYYFCDVRFHETGCREQITTFSRLRFWKLFECQFTTFKFCKW